MKFLIQSFMDVHGVSASSQASPPGDKWGIVVPRRCCDPSDVFFFLWFRIRDFVGMFQERGVWSWMLQEEVLLFFFWGKIGGSQFWFRCKKAWWKTLLRCLILGKNTCISHISGLRGPQWAWGCVVVSSPWKGGSSPWGDQMEQPFRDVETGWFKRVRKRLR